MIGIGDKRLPITVALPLAAINGRLSHKVDMSQMIVVSPTPLGTLQNWNAVILTLLLSGRNGYGGEWQYLPGRCLSQ